MNRASGILMAISSLPSPYGIGTMGRAAYDFADFLKAAGQKYWQVLPLGPLGAGNSPYQSCSSFAGNPLLIDFDMLIDDGLLLKDEVNSVDWGSETAHVDYDKLNMSRLSVLLKAKERGFARDKSEVESFLNECPWVETYAAYMAEVASGDLKGNTSGCLYTGDKSSTRELYTYIQFLFYKQWRALKSYANGLGIKIIGDIPIYVAMESVDVWAEPEQFKLDSDNRPVEVSGVPPDYFSEEGQLWGNPLYDYEKMKNDGYSWWIRRIGGLAGMYDAIRIDHFRGFASYWAVPANAATAKEGHWEKGPGMQLVGTLINWFSDNDFIAEDLGILSEDVHELLKESGLPGMKVLQFAFDSSGTSAYLPHCCNENSVCYTGTHDNATLREWLDTAEAEETAFAKAYLGLNEEEGYIEGIIRGGMCCASSLFVVPMQDWLGLGSEARMNTPGTVGDNWAWRMQDGAADETLAEKIRTMTKRYGR